MTFFIMLYITSLYLIYFTPGTFYLLIPLSYLAAPLTSLLTGSH